jgi:rubredoxin
MLEDFMADNYKRYMCLLCGFIYEEEAGWPEDGIEPGTRWEDVPLTWRCPDCGAAKDDFEMVEV